MPDTNLPKKEGADRRPILDVQEPPTRPFWARVRRRALWLKK
jgi:hypothetical protein